MLNKEPRKISVERRFEPIINSFKPVKLTLDQAGRSNYQQDSTSIYIYIYIYSHRSHGSCLDLPFAQSLKQVLINQQYMSYNKEINLHVKRSPNNGPLESD